MKESKFKLSIIYIGILILFFVICGFVIYSLFFMNKYIIKDFEKDIVHNYGDEFNPKQYVCYGNKKNCKEVIPTVEGDVNPNELGTYELKYTYNYKNKELILDQKVEVKDIEAPKINITSEEEIIACPNGKSDNLKYEISDNYDKEITNIKQVIEDNKLVLYATDSFENTNRLEIDATIKDDKGPTITLNGKKNVTQILGVKYKEQGAKADDNCDGEVEVSTSGTVNEAKEGTYTITYSATDSQGNKSEETRKVTVKQKEAGQRVVYLTFDDGPGAYTNQLLDVLKKYNVKATFFVTCKGDDSVIKREYDEGHTVALHTCTHDYKTVYASYDAYFKDLNNVKARVKRITGYDANIIRFPGGTSNAKSTSPNISMKSLAKQVVDKGYYYFDWNVSSGDAGGTTSADGVYNNVVNSLKSGTSVVLQHDIKKYSVEAVERIIQYGLENGYTFERLTPSSPKIRHGAGH